MATHSRILAWKIPWTEEPGGPQSIASQRVRHDGVTNAFTFTRWMLKSMGKILWINKTFVQFPSFHEILIHFKGKIGNLTVEKLVYTT